MSIPSISSIKAENLSIISFVLVKEAPAGRLICEIKTPWSSSGINPVGIILNAANISTTKTKYTNMVILLPYTKYSTPFKYILVSFSNNTLKALKVDLIAAVKKFDGFLSGSSSLKRVEHIAGESDKAQTAESAIDAAIQTANCLYIKPVKPVIKVTGTNTAIRTRAIATNAPPTSCIVNCAASTGVLPSSRCLFTFSITTIASSTTTATANTIANSVSRFIDIPNIAIIKNVPIKDTGIVTQGTSVALQSPKNTKMIKITINEVNKIVCSTSVIDSLTKIESSCIIASFKLSGRVLLSSFIFFVTWLTTSIVLASGSGTT